MLPTNDKITFVTSKFTSEKGDDSLVVADADRFALLLGGLLGDFDDNRVDRLGGMILLDVSYRLLLAACVGRSRWWGC